MRILMHAPYYPPEVGGMESHVHYLSRALVAGGHDVQVVTSHSRPHLPPFEEMDGVGVWRTWMPARNPVGWAAHAFGSMPRMASLGAEADVLHAQDIAAVLPCRFAQTVRGAPIVTTYHSSHFLRRADSPLWKPVFRWYLGMADHNLAASEEIADVAGSLADGIRVEALTNGVDTDVFRRVEPTLPKPSDGRARLIVPRRLFEKNGVEYFVRAMPDIVRDVQVEAVIVGDGPERERLEKLAGDLGVREHIDFMGARAHGEMPGLLSSADLAVFPSLMEATSVAALECMACEVPVAASDVGGLPEIVNTRVGALFEAGDAPSLATVVVDLLRGETLPGLGAAARQAVVDRWSNRRLAQRHVEVYEEVVARRAA